MTLFDHLNNIYINKGDWNSISDADKKTWNTFMVNKYISMLGSRECVLSNEIQKYSKLQPTTVYSFYKHSFSPRKRFAKYIKNAKESKVNAELVKILADYYQISFREAIEYVDLVDINTLLTNLGYTEKEIKILKK